jgi:alpha-galactosidase
MDRAMKLMELESGGAHLVLGLHDDAPVALLHLGSAPFVASDIPEEHRWTYRLVEIRAAGEDHDYIEAGRYAGSAVGGRLRYVSHTLTPSQCAIRQRDDRTGLVVESTLQFIGGVLETRTRIENSGEDAVTLQAASSFFLNGFTKSGRLPKGLRTLVHVPRNGWYAEFQWAKHLASDLGLNSRFAFGSRHETISSTGTWCSSNYLPMGCLENAESGDVLLWEILHGGSWSWQVAEAGHQLYVHVAGPTDAESNWHVTLAPGEAFTTVPCAVAAAASFDGAVGALTRHRRRTHLAGHEKMPVVFNDYMNCLMGDPSEAAVMPLIDAAAEAGAEVYCIDAGWFAAPGQRWSSTLGNWDPNPERFPSGLSPVFYYIRSKGMTPGIWFEIETMTENLAQSEAVPREWFFERHGRPVISHRRLQLDFRNPDVRAFAREAIDKVLALGCGFMKLDYNFDSGPGSELGSANLGQSLVDYEAAFLSWLDSIRADHPELLIEHCASGGQRLGRPYLDRTNSASTSDEGDPMQIARIVAAAPTMLLPEQNGNWAVPEPGHDAGVIASTMLCGAIGRLHIAGKLSELSNDQTEVVQQAVRLHKAIRADIARSVPLWPLGLPGYHDEWICLGLQSPDSLLLAVWRRTGTCRQIDIPVEGLEQAELLFPTSIAGSFERLSGQLRIKLEERSCALFRIPSLRNS